MRHIVYNFASDFVISKEIIRSIENRLKIIYPSDYEYIRNKAESVLFKMAMILLITVMSLFAFGNISIEYIIVVGITEWIIIKNIANESLMKMELSLLRKFDKYITDVRFQFQYSGEIDSAIHEANNNAEYDMMIHGLLFLEYLNDEENRYKEVCPNYFFMTFFSLCQTVLKFGDINVDNQSSFLKNLGYLKDDINCEILKIEKTNSVFMGLKALALLPIFAIKPIELWALSNMIEIGEYYSSVKGKLTALVLIVVSLLIYSIVNRLKFPNSYNSKKAEWTELILSNKKIEKLIMKRISKRYKYYFKMDSLLKSVVYKYNIKEFIVRRIVIAIAISMLCMILLTVTGVSLIIGLLVSSLIGVLTYYMQFASLLFQEQLMRLERENEIVRFQSVLMILMNFERMNIEQILSWLEEFAVVFKNDIENMNDELGFKGFVVFEKAKERTHFLPFERIIDGFIASDSIGIKKAFEYIEADRNYYLARHKQENEVIIENKGLIAKTVAFMPLCLVIVLQLIIPFVTMGLQQLSSFSLM